MQALLIQDQEPKGTVSSPQVVPVAVLLPLMGPAAVSPVGLVISEPTAIRTGAETPVARILNAIAPTPA